MWPFKKKEIDNYRICYHHKKYFIQRLYKNSDKYETLHFYAGLKEYEWYLTPTKYVLNFDSLEEAREKVSELIPQYFSAETPRG